MNYKNKNIIKIYKKLYNLPELTYKETVDFDFFRICKKEHKFIVIALYNEKREFLLLRDFNKNIGWELVGGYVAKEESIEEAVNRIVLKETGLTIDELQPIAIVNNNFEWKNRTISHVGIAFTALVRGRIKPQSKNIEIIYTKTIPDVMAYQDKEILKIAKQIVETKQYGLSYEEIESGKKFYLLHYFNKYFVKPIFRKLASNKIQKTLLKLISNKPKSIIDIACGDDDFIFQLEKIYNPEICVANDISWKTTSILRQNKKTKVIFTNHNVLDLPFNYKFDLVIFKNTLHHIPPEEQGNLIQKLSTLAKQLIIIDVEDPYRSNFLSKLWHWYYVYLLGDQGGYFLNFEEFKKLISENIKDHDVNFGIISTIKGKYFYASLLSQNTKGEEVEIKAEIEFSQIKNIKEKLLSLGAFFQEKIKESDIYFTALHRDFIKTKECLRIRERDHFLELTYKGPTTKEMADKKQFWKKEINIPLRCSKEEIIMLLESLGFKRVVEVEKEREKFVIGKHEITIDRVKNCGYFLEIERIVEDEKEREKAISENLILLKKLEISEKEIIAEPYRDLVLKKLKNEI
jgi:adenylate cyclase class 2